MSEDLMEMIQRIHAAAGGETDEERRGAPRIRREGQITIQVPNPNGNLILNVQFRDCSSTGIGLMAEADMEVGAKFFVEIKQAGRPPRLIAYNVVRCEKTSEGSYIIGARVKR